MKYYVQYQSYSLNLNSNSNNNNNGNNGKNDKNDNNGNNDICKGLNYCKFILSLKKVIAKVENWPILCRIRYLVDFFHIFRFL